MQIDTISYERRVSDGQYGNRMFRASATLDENDNPDEAALVLRGFVFDQIAADEKAEAEREEAARQAREAEYARLRAERESERAREMDERQKQLDAALSDGGEYDDIPFDDDEEEDE